METIFIVVGGSCEPGSDYGYNVLVIVAIPAGFIFHVSTVCALRVKIALLSEHVLAENRLRGLSDVLVATPGAVADDEAVAAQLGC